jgi:2-(1,2-epoxy-1,2-dihydrophenyl)acetyl-CoA isomerase
VIAAVNGMAYGVRFSLALACDVILASEKARFCRVFVHVGLAPDAGSTYFLPRMIGTARTFPLIFSGEPIGVQEALARGLVRKVVPGEKLPEEALALAKKLAQGPTRAMGLAKKLVYTGLGKSHSDQLDEKANDQTIGRLTEDHREGLRAFKEKRSPKFQGK